MRCIFCKNDSSSSVSREHIIPESLGNTMHTLPPGVVCDACNNYFSRKVEKPFLESESVRALRFEQALVSKKGKIPSLTGIITPIEAKVTLTRFPSGPIIASVDTHEEALSILEQSSGGHLIFPSPPPRYAIRRRCLPLFGKDCGRGDGVQTSATAGGACLFSGREATRPYTRSRSQRLHSQLVISRPTDLRARSEVG